MLDLRLPSGLFFAITGLILTPTGLAVPGAQVDVYTGLAMILFGAFLLLLAWRARRRA